ncbi:MAG TPA: HEAT repeat domain-containing protein, partial [Planctomycetota bacterium]|nr:HEAT repeat domain-containing protein [Planctomycetota bacterium]
MTLLLALLLLSPQEDVAKLVEKLRSESLEARDEATRKLKELGRAAKAELEKASKDPDAGFATRAQVLLERLRLMDTLSQDLQRALPGIADTLAFGTDRDWTKALIQAEELLRPQSRLPLVKRAELDLLALRAARGAESAEDRKAICRIVRDRRLASAMPELVRYLDDPDREVLDDTVEILQRIPCAEGPRRLRERTRSEIPEMRAEAIQFLRDLRCREAAADAVRLIADSDAEVRGSAASALAPLVGKEAATELNRLLKDTDDEVRRYAIWGLLELYEKTSGPDLVKLLDDPEQIVRRTAAYALGELR